MEKAIVIVVAVEVGVQITLRDVNAPPTGNIHCSKGVQMI